MRRPTAAPAAPATSPVPYRRVLEARLVIEPLPGETHVEHAARYERLVGYVRPDEPTR